MFCLIDDKDLIYEGIATFPPASRFPGLPRPADDKDLIYEGIATVFTLMYSILPALTTKT